ncbi:MAG: amidohydrolase family protein [Candidatus Glassbacteria bacterium]|nr:amidohydrolase family protein [Candidatus Glassbacteria bacterium]
MKKTLPFVIVIILLVLWNLCLELRLSFIPEPFHPPLDPAAAARDTADGGFSREYGFYMRPYCYFWSDAHTHTCFGDLPREERIRELNLLHNLMYELDIVNCAVFCKTEEDLALVDSLGKDAPVWYVEYNDPDVEKLRSYYERYHIRAVKKHNIPLFYAQFNGDSVEFPLGSGKMQPVSVEMMVSPEWMRFYEVCQELGLPITWHTNNRYGPSPYNFGGDNSKCWDGLPYNNDYVLHLVERILETYPGIDLILCHQGFMGHTKLSRLFERHPNLYIDTSAGYILQDGDYLTDEERARIRPFFIRWADRILFGSDANAMWEELDTVSEHELRRHIYNHVHPFKRFIQHLYLPQPALSKVAHRNFERLFKMEPAGDWFY